MSMLPVLRSSFRRTSRPKRALVAVSSSRIQFANLSTGTQIPRLGTGGAGRRSAWVPVAVGLGTVTLSAALLFNGAIRLDAAEVVEDFKAKPKPKPRAKQRKQDADAENTSTSTSTPTSQTEKLIQVKEEGARSEGSHSDTPSGEVSEGEGEQGGEAEGGGGGAFNPETGEINWDCPCLGGMAHGPCGQEFRDAFSCFVYSEEEPKGINCVDKFKAMQDCFRSHPEVYGEEILRDDDEEEEEEGRVAQPSGIDSPGLEGEALPEPDPTAAPPSGIVNPQK